MSVHPERLEDGPTGLERWLIPTRFHTDSWVGAVQSSDPRGIVLDRVHPEFVCRGRPCVIHNPTEHNMADWPLLWRDDRGIFERVCEHGVGHPDPDQFDYWRENGMEGEAVHGCDGCCAPA